MLSISNLTVSFLNRTAADRPQAFSAVSGVDLEVPDGSFTALVGESGSGKSVTANSLLRLVPHPLGRTLLRLTTHSVRQQSSHFCPGASGGGGD